MKTTGSITNPILTGFQPDPSICRVGEEYYIATSTFEYVPGIQIHHSRDLKHWRLISRPLDRESLIDMRGQMPSEGVIAPCLSHDGHSFWLAYSNFCNRHGRFLDNHNMVTRSPDLLRGWEDPYPLHSAGIDVSCFHDLDGRSYVLTNLFTPFRPGFKFGQVLLQEVDRRTVTLIGEARVIFPGTELDVTEGPHLYRRGDWYYLVCAEGGTGGGHAMTVARSRCVWGPYDVHPENPILTARGQSEWPLQKTGHASWVDTPDGDWMVTFLCSRMRGPNRRSMLGRETALEYLVWGEDAWPRLHSGSRQARTEIPALQSMTPCPWPEPEEDTTFQNPELDACWQWLREPSTSEWLDLIPGRLRLLGRSSFHSRSGQSLIARRLTSHACEFSAECVFTPSWETQLAGIMLRYDEYGFYDLSIGWDHEVGRVLRLLYAENDRLHILQQCPLHTLGPIQLRLRVQDGEGDANWKTPEEKTWKPMGEPFEADRISDEFQPGGFLRFTGAMFALHAQDMMGTNLPADFHWCHYRDLAYGEDGDVGQRV